MEKIENRILFALRRVFFKYVIFVFSVGFREPLVSLFTLRYWCTHVVTRIRINDVDDEIIMTLSRARYYPRSSIEHGVRHSMIYPSVGALLEKKNVSTAIYYRMCVLLSGSKGRKKNERKRKKEVTSTSMRIRNKEKKKTSKRGSEIYKTYREGGCRVG